MPSKTENPSSLMTVREVAAELNIGVSTVWRNASLGRFPQQVKICGASRWRRADIEALIQGEAA